MLFWKQVCLHVAYFVIIRDQEQPLKGGCCPYTLSVPTLKINDGMGMIS